MQVLTPTKFDFYKASRDKAIKCFQNSPFINKLKIRGQSMEPYGALARTVCVVRNTFADYDFLFTML